MQINLTDEEHALLAELLDADFRELKEEIGKTEGREYQTMLRARERTLTGLLEKVSRPGGWLASGPRPVSPGPAPESPRTARR